MRAYLGEPEYEAAMDVKPPLMDDGESEGHRYERWVVAVVDAALAGMTRTEVTRQEREVAGQDEQGRLNQPGFPDYTEVRLGV